MTKPTLPAPRYSIWQAISAALALSTRAIEEVRALSRQPGPQGEPGKDGAPGNFDPEKLSIAVDNERGVFLKYDAKEIGRIAGVHRGTFKSGEAYRLGDTLTYDNSEWRCRVGETSDKPGTSASWQLSVRKGENGRNGRDLTTPRSTIPFGDK